MNYTALVWDWIIERPFLFWTFTTEIKADSWSAIASVISALIALAALFYTHKQWQKISVKIGMIEDSGKAAEILPTWYTGRMMNDCWLFGLYTTDGRIIIINSITAVSDDGMWLDVELADPHTGEQFRKTFSNCIHAIDMHRTRASVRVDAIVCAVDLQTS